MDGTDTWQHFEIDPRLPAHAGLRASDRDRDVVLDALAAAYAEGRLDREELDERTTAVRAARTLGDVVPLIADVAPSTAPPRRGPLVPASDQRAEAVRRYEHRRHQALWSFLVPTLICWVVYVAAALDHGPGFPWPLFVTLGTGVGLAKLVTSRESSIADIQHQLERKAARRGRRDLPPAPEPTGW